MRKLLLSLCALASMGTVVAQKSVTIQQGDLKLRLDTRVTFEGAAYIPQTSLDGIKWGDDKFSFSNGTNLTQARFGVWGFFGDKWRGKFDIRAIDGRIALQDIFLDYFLTPHTYVRAGYYIDPISVDVNAASNYPSLNTPIALSLLSHQERFLGVSITNFGKHHYLIGGLYGTNLSGRNVANRASDGWGIAGRAAYVPINEDQSTLYVGAYARYRTPDVGSNGQKDALRFVTHPGSTIDGRNFINSTLSNVSNYMIFGGEVALTRGRWHLMGEYLTNLVNFKSDNLLYGGRQNAFFHGGYLTASYMIKGKQRKYIDGWGIFSPLANVEKGGSFELIGRYSYANGNDRDGNDPLANTRDIMMGSSHVATLGINWYPNGNMIIGINYNFTSVDKYATAGGLLTREATAEQGAFGFHTLQCRIQYCF